MDLTQRITRRRALALGAAGSLSGLLLRVPDGAQARGGARTRALELPAGAIPAGGRAGTVIRTGRAFDLVGLRGVDLRGAHAELRVRRPGQPWSPWVPLGAGADHGPDHPRRAARASDPVWAGGARELQLRARHALHGGALQLVTVPGAPAGARLRAAGATSRGADDAPPVIIPRSQWGADAVPPRAAPSYGVVQVAFVHHTVSANDYAPEDSARIVLAIAKYHRDSNGWNDIGYNLLVDKYGQIFEGRAGGVDRAVIGAQAGGWNSQSTGIATIGDFDATALPEPALQALTRLLSWKLTLHGVPLSGTVQLTSGGGKENRYPYGQLVTLQRISGHRDGCTTDCPGAVLYGQLGDLRARVVALGPIAGRPAAGVTLTTDATRVVYGEALTLAGRALRADGTAAADAAVSIQKRSPSGTWARVGRVRTGADGAFTTTLTFKRPGPIRAVAQVPGSGHVRSPAISIDLVPVVTVLAPGSRSRVQAGRTVAVRGTIGPSGSVRILVERQDHGRWVSAGRIAATVKGTAFAASVPLVKPALYRLTALAGPSSAPVRADPIFVRAVRHAASVGGGQGGASPPSTAGPSGAAGGAGAP